MAGYKTHISVGAVAGLAMAALALVQNWVNGLVQTVLIFMITLFAAFLPDVDSETGKPFRVIFTTYATIAAGLTFFFLLKTEKEQLLLLLVLPLLVFTMIRFVISLIFNKLTVHRGMFHSIPAALIAFSFFFFGSGVFNVSPKSRFAYGMAGFVGYLVHLILDEIFATKILSGELVTKSSFGSATKLFSKKKLNNIITYGILVFSIAMNFFLEIMKKR